MASRTPVSEFTQALLRGSGPLAEWEGTIGTVRSFVSGICSSAERVDLSVDELLTVLRRRLGELAEAVTLARSALEETAGRWAQEHPQ
jgi:hypothetical protein